MISVLASFTSMAAGNGSKGASLPFRVVLDLDECGRLCYAGHKGKSIIYHDGYAVTPDSSFCIEAKGTDMTNIDPSELHIEVAAIYENADQTGCSKEIIKKLGRGDIKLGEFYPLFSENMIESLISRDRFYSTSLQGIQIQLGYKQSDMTQKVFLYVCSDEDFDDYLGMEYRFMDKD